MKTWYNRFVHRNIFYHQHIFVKPKQFVTRSIRFWDRVHMRKTKSYLIPSVQGYPIDVDVFCVKVNNPDVIILIHGHFTDKTEFDLIVPVLCAMGYDVVVYNVYGKWTPFSTPLYTYGKKERVDLQRLIETCQQYERIHLVGHSLGAAIVAEYTDMFNQMRVCTKTMVALYETLDQAIDVGMENAGVPFFTFSVNAKLHMKQFSNQNDVNLYTQDMKSVLSNKDESHLLIFGEKDVRAPYFQTDVEAVIMKDTTHTNFFTSKRYILSEHIHHHIQKNIKKST